MRTAIVAYDENRAIGRDGDIPWRGELPVDMAFFRSATNRQAVIMGRKTFESLPEVYRPLPGRKNIILSLSERAIEGAQVAENIYQAFKMAGPESSVIGGAQVYNLALPMVDRVLATEIHTEVDGADTFFPALPEEEWMETRRRPFEADEDNAYSGDFVLYMRRRVSGQSLRKELEDRHLRSQIESGRRRL